jgi:hypothetical protein
MRPVAALTVLSCLVLAACGGSDGDQASTTTEPGGGATLEELWRAPGDDTAVIPGTANHEPGQVRVSFLVVDGEGQPVTLPTARVFAAEALDAKPFLETEAKLERIGLPGEHVADATHIYVANLRLSRPGKYWMLAEPEGGSIKVQALGNVLVAKEDPPPDVGEPAVASPTPTLASTGGDTSALTTRNPPDESLLRYSVADALEANVPFVVTFATPKFCSSRVCGPVVDVVEEVSRRFEGENIRFIHVEVFTDNDPTKGYNEWMQQWDLPTEPWTFVVDGTGTIVERFEGTLSVDELETAVREKLLS